MKRVLPWAIAVLAGLALGVASAFWAVENGRAGFMQEAGGWRWSKAAGSTGADMYTRAIIAREGLLALSADEAVYLTREQDENGRPLTEACVYELSGGPLPARWWSVTLYAPDDFLARNTDAAFSVDATRAGNDGAWRARIAPVRGEAASWISSRGARNGFSLTLRAYNPEAGFPRDGAALPQIRTLSCPEGAP